MALVWNFEVDQNFVGIPNPGSNERHLRSLAGLTADVGRSKPRELDPFSGPPPVGTALRCLRRGVTWNNESAGTGISS